MKRTFNSIFLILSLVFVFTGCSEDDDPISEPSEYTLDGVTTYITTSLFWKAGNLSNGTLDHIRLVEPVVNTALYDLFKITPVPGPNDLKGTYIYSRSGDIGTYNLTLSHLWDGGSDFDWTTMGDTGQVLEIKLIVDKGADSIYDITISSFDLNYGNWNYFLNKWVSEGNKHLIFHYRGVIRSAS